jgi:uncharacterized protein HemX
MANDDKQTKTRDRQIARNESERQTIGDIRVSVWAIALVVIAGLVIVTWLLIQSR